MHLVVLCDVASHPMATSAQVIRSEIKLNRLLGEDEILLALLFLAQSSLENGLKQDMNCAGISKYSIILEDYLLTCCTMAWIRQGQELKNDPN